MNSSQLQLFLIGTALLMLFSWFVSLREKRYHGIPRFFAFEGLLMLALLQRSVWFNAPLSPLQITSWSCFILSVFYVTISVINYFNHAKPGRNFENSTKLVTTGLYRYVRHPMYGSLLFLGWGMFFKNATPVTIALIALITISLYFTSKVEEKEMIKRFGDEYKSYMSKTKRWIPFVL